MADLIKEVYGESKLIASGSERGDIEERVAQINSGALSYKYYWKDALGDLTFQLI